MLNKLPQYDVIIVNYNGKKIIDRCLSSIYSSSILPESIIIYDNDSQDGSPKMIKKKYPKVNLIKGKENLGFGRANNEAMKYSKSEFILFMNNDVILDKNCSEELLEGFNEQKLAILNPLIIKGWDKRRDPEIYAFGAEMNASGFNYGLYDLGPDRNNLNSFSAACCMIRGSVIKKLKFEKRFFLYFEEPDISIRLLQKGMKIGRKIGAKCYHLENYSSGKNRALGICFRQYYAIQNHWYMLGKYWPTSLLFSALPLNFAHLLFNCLFFIKNRQFVKLNILGLAFLNFFQGRKVFKHQHYIWVHSLPKGQLSKALKLRKKVYSKSS